jgi:hypothetical protein
MKFNIFAATKYSKGSKHFNPLPCRRFPITQDEMHCSSKGLLHLVHVPLCRSQALHKHFIGFTLIPAVSRPNLQSILTHRGANYSLEGLPAFRITGAEICTSLATGQDAVSNLVTKTTLDHLSSLSISVPEILTFHIK